jgi:hypothetical protein
VITGDAATTNGRPVKATDSLRGCAHPSRELCTEAEHEPVDSLVREILFASSAGGHCTFVTEGAGLGQGEKSAVFSPNSDSKSKWMNLFKCFSDSVDIIRGQARNRHANGTNGFDINPFSSICDSDRRLLDSSEASARNTLRVVRTRVRMRSVSLLPRHARNGSCPRTPMAGIMLQGN